MLIASVPIQSLLLWFALIVPLASHGPACPNAESYASDAYSYARKAYRADDLDELRGYIRKARSSAENASVAAEECKCADAVSSADDAASYAKKALQSDEFDEAVNFSKKAMRAAEELESNIADCSSKN